MVFNFLKDFKKKFKNYIVEISGKEKFNREGIKEKLKYIRKFYNDLSDEEFKQRMKNLGFEIVENGKGEFIYTEKENE